MNNTVKKTDAIGDALEAVTASAKPTQLKKSVPPQANPTPKEAPQFPPPTVNTGNAPEPQKLQKRLPNGRMQLQGYQHNLWEVSIPAGTTIQEVLDPTYWVHVAQQFKPQDTVIAITEDGTWYARLYVLSADRLWAKMFNMECHDLTASYKDMPKTMEEDYEIKYTPIGKYAVHRIGQTGYPPLKGGFDTKLQAYEWLDGHIKSLNK